jgi:hypothetical protein
LQATSIAKEIKTPLYQMALWQKKLADLLTMVVIVKTHLQTKKPAHVGLFSSEVSLG